MRQSLAQYINGGIAAAEGYANLNSRFSRRRSRRAASASGARSSGS